MPEVYAIGKGLDPNIQPEKQVLKPLVVTKAKEVPQIKPRLGQRRAGLRCKINTPVSHGLVNLLCKYQKTNRTIKNSSVQSF